MSKAVTFYLGPAVGLTKRDLTIRRIPRSGEVVEEIEPAVDVELASSATNSVQELPDDEVWRATLIDTLESGDVSKPITIGFNTEQEKFPGPAGDPSETLFRVLSIEQLPEPSSSSSGEE